MQNEMKMEFDAISANESFARVAVAAFMTSLDPTLEEISDVKTAVSEAVTNAVIHGYRECRTSEACVGDELVQDSEAVQQISEKKKIMLRCRVSGDILHIEIEDKGCGIENIEKAMEPLFTTLPDENRSGMGFSFMEAFMDDVEVESEPGKGTLVRMVKKIGTSPWVEDADQPSAIN